MKKDYEASRSTLSSYPIFTRQARAQAFLLNPAKDRNLQQLTEDYQQLALSNKNNRARLERLKSAYVINWARSEPDNAIAWANRNIVGLDTQPKIRNQFFKLWYQHEKSDANQWLNNNPEVDATIEKPVITIPIIPVFSIRLKPTSITLPR